MAFVYRAERSLNISAPKCTPQQVGPGSYGNMSAYKRNHGYAPFQSTAERNVGGAPAGNTVTPGPGSYLAQMSEVDAVSASGSAFVNKVDRFKAKVSTNKLTPGPGTYQLQQKWVKDVKSAPAPTERPVTWVRVPTAPSIPAPSQSYGYEEGNAGELVMQKPSDVGYTGARADKPGPGVYNPSDKLCSSGQRVADFGAAKATRTQWATKRTPGPGYYQMANQDPQTIIAPGRMTSNFQSSTLRPYQRTSDAEKVSPGPGNYNVTEITSAFKTERVPETMQFFGSTSKRGFETEAGDYQAPFATKTPGPGQYENRQVAFSKRKAHVHAQRHGVGFDQRSERFGNAAGRHHLGPGEYNAEEAKSMAKDLSSKVVGRNGVFGSTSRRFHVLKKDKIPGPGAYESGEQGDPRVASSSVFVSTKDRFGAKNRGTCPDVGTYNLGSTWIKPSKRRPPVMNNDKVFINGSPRFPKKPITTMKNHVPGPGAYGAAKAHQPHTTTSRALVSNAQRFADKTSGAALNPGPGTYGHSLAHDGLLKRSFNVTVEGAY